MLSAFDVSHLALHGDFRWDNPFLSTLEVSDGRVALVDLAGADGLAPLIQEGITVADTRNYATALLMTASEVNTEQVLYFGAIVVTKDALDTLAARTGAN